MSAVTPAHGVDIRAADAIFRYRAMMRQMPPAAHERAMLAIDALPRYDAAYMAQWVVTHNDNICHYAAPPRFAVAACVMRAAPHACDI